MLDLCLAIGHTLRLYKTDVTAGLTRAQINALTVASFTEANFTGYVAKTLTGGAWVTTQGDPTTGTYAQQTFTSTANQAAQVIYGYYVCRASDNALIWHERFAGPLTISLNGDTIQITPTITLEDDQETTVAARGLAAPPQILTADSVGYTTSGITDFALSNFDADATRNYRVHLTSSWNLDVAANWFADLWVDGVATLRVGDSGGIAGGILSTAVLWQPATGQYDLAIALGEATGTSTFTWRAAANAPRQFWIEDIGPR